MTQPTSRNKYKTSYDKRQVYNDYKKNRRSTTRVNREVFLRIVSEFNKKIMKQIIYKNHKFDLPYRLGYIQILKRKTMGLEFDNDGNIIGCDLVVNRYATRKLWKEHPELVFKKYKYFLNEETDGYVYKFTWYRATGFVHNIHLYRFIPTRLAKKALQRALLNDQIDTDFFEI